MSTKISAASAVSTLSDSYALPLSTGGSSANKVTVSTLAQYAAKYAANIGVIISHKTVSQTALRVQDLARYLDSLYGSYDVLGLVIPSGSTRLVVALDEPDDTMYWSSSSTLYGTAITSARKAVEDFDGEGHAEAAAALTDTDYAMGYCNSYSKEGDMGNGIPSGSWWLPSCGELVSILLNYEAINFALTALSSLGVTTTTLTRAYYWSSSEFSSSYAWNVGLTNGYVRYYSKTSYSNRVRPVSAYQDMVSIS